MSFSHFSRQRLIVGIAIFVCVLIAAWWYLWRPQPATGEPESSFQVSSTQAFLPAVLIPEGAPIEGPFAAKVTLVEFLDYECPGCGAYHPIVKRLRETFRGQIRFVVRHFPLVEAHAHAKGAAIAAVCAQRQGKFFEYSDVLFAHQDALTRGDLERYAGELDLDASVFQLCLDDPQAATTVIRDRVHGQALGVQFTPSFFLNGKLLPDLDEDGLRQAIEKALRQ